MTIFDKHFVEQLLKDYQTRLVTVLADERALADSKNEREIVAGILVPQLFATLVDRHGDEAAKDILHAESSVSRGATASLLNCSRSLAHPFGKVLSAGVLEIAEAWKSPAGLTAACPDFALGPPYKVVFAARFFRSKPPSAAPRELVEGLYQTFFYRALSRAQAQNPKVKAQWDYEYGCFVCIDATGHLESAWRTGVDERVRESFWHSANIFPLIVSAPKMHRSLTS